MVPARGRRKSQSPPGSLLLLGLHVLAGTFQLVSFNMTQPLCFHFTDHSLTYLLISYLRNIFLNIL